MEAAQCKLHIAALVAQFLKRSNNHLASVVIDTTLQGCHVTEF